MPDSKYPISGSIRVWWLPANGLANPEAPTQAELQAGLDISDAISWNDKDFGVQASSTTSDPAITATGNTQNRGAAQYGGSFSFYYPAEFSDNTNLYSLVWDALHRPGTAGYIVVRVDGRELADENGTVDNPGWLPRAGDMVTVYRVETAGYSEQITGEEAFRYTVGFLPKGLVAAFVLARPTATPEKPIIVVPTSLVTGEKGIAVGTLLGREYTRGLKWVSANPDVATVSANGVIKTYTDGSTEITAIDKATGAVSTPAPLAVS